MLAASGAKDGPVGAWLDLAALVSSGSKAPGVSDFAREIGSEIYIDVANWHLVRARCSRRNVASTPRLTARGALRRALPPAQFLKDARYDVGVANAIAARAASNGGKISADDVTAILKKVSVKLGAGKKELSLFDVMPARCVDDLVDISQRFAREL